MSLNTSIKLNEVDTRRIVDFIDIEARRHAHWNPIELFLDDGFNHIKFVITKTDENKLELVVFIDNKKTGNGSGMTYGVLDDYGDLFGLYKFEDFGHNYTISLLPAHIENSFLYESTMKNLLASFQHYSKYYIKNINLNTNGYSKTEQLWNMIYPFLLDLYRGKAKIELWTLIRDKLYYYGYSDAVCFDDYYLYLINKSILLEPDVFNFVLSGLCVYIINRLIDENKPINKYELKNIADSLSQTYFNDIYKP